MPGIVSRNWRGSIEVGAQYAYNHLVDVPIRTIGDYRLTIGVERVGLKKNRMITLTDRATTELKDLIKSQDKPSAALRVWVAGGGCSGLSYGMALDDGAPESEDNVFEQDGIKLYVDPLSLNYMDGAQVDYVDDVLGGGFKIENPNAVSSCGCGSSFKTADSEAGSGGCGSCGCAR